MKISTKSRYGLMACYIIAKNYNDPVSLTTISQESGISLKYLEQLMLPLRKADIIISVRGSSGGYQLSTVPEKIKLGSIMRALEDGLELVDCLSGDCSNKCKCPTYVVWEKLYQGINELLDSITLSDMLSYKEKDI